MSQKIELTYEQEKDTVKRSRSITLPIDAIAVEDWLGADRTTVIPNFCRVTYGGQTYKVKMSRVDLEKELESTGTKIHRTKKQ